MIAASALALSPAFVVSCSSGNPFLEEWDTPYGMPPFEKISVEHYLPAIQAGIAQQTAEIEAIKNNKETPSFANVIAPYELSGEILSKVVGVLYNVSETDSNPEIDKVMEKAAVILSEHEDNIFMDSAFFAKVKAVYDSPQQSLTREQQMTLKKIYKRFERNGIALGAADQDTLKAINSRLAALSQTFGTNLLSENNAFKDEFGIGISQYSAEMASCPDRDRRERMFRAYSSRGNNGNAADNNALCVEILKLRARKAKLLGFDNFAQYQLDDKMAGSPVTVDNFLSEIMAASVKKAGEEIADMQKVMDREIAAGKLPKGTKIQPWDWFYYAEKVRAEKYALDEEQTRPYFKLENVRDGVFSTAKRIYGVSIEEESGLPVYNPEVKTFKVTDSDGYFLGIFMTDYILRPSKRGGAWMNNFRDQYTDAKGRDVRPIIVNVCNFSPATSTEPSLLTIDNVETIFHEFGHALHGLLTRCNYKEVSGTSVARDFVETFSQFNENWAFQKDILSSYAKHYETGEVIPDSLVTKILLSRKFNQGFMTGELCAASILDMKWHELTEAELEGIDVQEFEKKVCREMNLPDEIIPRYRTTYFNHIFNSGYSAGYYSYLWSEVLDKDAFEYFEKVGVYDKDLALKFRQTFLERGGSEEPMVLYEMFRGAQPDPGALVRARGLE